MGNSSNKSVADTMADNTVGNSSMADNSVGDSSMANSSNKAMASDTVANNTVANDTVGDRGNNASGDDSRANPVSADTVGGAWVVSDSSNVGSESLGLGHTPVLSLQGLHHGLVGHLASADSDSRGNSNSGGNSNSRSDSSGVGNASNETGSSHEASHCTVASQELGSGGGSGHEGGDTEGGLRVREVESDFDIVAKRTENDMTLFYLHAVLVGFDGMTIGGWRRAFKLVEYARVHSTRLHTR